MTKETKSIRRSKLLSLVLRHRPEKMGLVLDEAGWADVDAVLHGFALLGEEVTRVELDAIVKSSDKQRFAVSDDGLRIRASQGHSVSVELGYEPAAPPPILFHGTTVRFLSSIREMGLLRGERHHVHLSATTETAMRVGGRHGRPLVLVVRAAEMTARGYVFFLSANGVWLTDHVPPAFIDFPSAP